MNIEAYNLDSLRKLVRALQAENKELRALLDKAEIPYSSTKVFSETPAMKEDYDPDQGGRISEKYIDKVLANRFFSMFWGRQDVFAKRAKNGNYYPQCDNRWNQTICPKQKGENVFCNSCEQCKWIELTPEIIVNHLLGYREDGTDVIGVYPLLADGTCRFLVFDFDNHEKNAEESDFANKDEQWHEEVDALRLICKQNNIDVLVERSRSGKGAHVWIFFQKPIAAATARNFGLSLLDKGAASINMKSFRYYDRMFPTQDTTDSIGNLIALPLQGSALRNGNSAFVDENWNAYPDQWERLFATRKLSQEEINGYIAKWQGELFGGNRVTEYSLKSKRPRPWKRTEKFFPEDVDGKLHIVLADGVYVDALNLQPRLQNQIRCMAAFDNPQFYKNKRLGYSNYYNSSVVYMGTDVEGYVKIPSGLKEELCERCSESGIPYDIEDAREKGCPIRVRFNGELKEEQKLAVKHLLSYEHGILSAATAFGKTVVCSYVIAQKHVNTLILLESIDLVSQWEEALNRFLVIDEEVPEYQTKTGRIKKRESVIGTLKAGKDTTTGIIDIAMIGSLYKKGKFHERLKSYGMVIMDECHHGASVTAQEILKQINSKYVYGVSATPVRSDNLEKINYMLLGPIRHQYTALQRNTEQGIEHLVIPRYTRVANVLKNSEDINEAYVLIADSEIRTEQLAEDVKSCVKKGRTPLVLTRYKEHAKKICERVKEYADYVFLLYGGNSNKENEAIRKQMKDIPRESSFILVATGQKIGEGFDCPRLDTLMLAAPVSFGGRLEQYLGRIGRDYEGKEEIVVYDYIDSHLKKFNDMYLKRLKTYKRIGFKIASDVITEKQDVNAIYDAGNYMDVFEKDIVEAEKEVIICSPQLESEKVYRFISIIKSRQEAGVSVIVITEEPERNKYDKSEFLYFLADQMHKVGIVVRFVDDELEHFAVLDKTLVWHGGMNLLGKEDVWDNLIRVRDEKAAGELLEMAYKNG